MIQISKFLLKRGYIFLIINRFTSGDTVSSDHRAAAAVGRQIANWAMPVSG